ncbi:METTL3 [Cordylochernes scorpioides]|uniref:mRNA m(6)A methyltransferase n=1 Tax=Cordylochernes scorpioides TaxID=51811 RepID=A0ABY6K715_9ARAC|nr:METTL3 [Cordylochernes scorpioides]
MTDTWSDIQAIKSQRSSLRERIERRKKLSEGLVQSLVQSVPLEEPENTPPPEPATNQHPISPEVEHQLLLCLTDAIVDLPIEAKHLHTSLCKSLGHELPLGLVHNLLLKFSTQKLITLKETLTPDGERTVTITSAEHTKILAVTNDIIASLKLSKSRPQPAPEEPAAKKPKHDKGNDLLENLLSTPSTREKETKKYGEEILELLSKPTAKERSLIERFSSHTAQVKEYCPRVTKEECIKMSNTTQACTKLHFKKILQKHTDENLGDCSFLNTCFHMDTCKYVHYEVEVPDNSVDRKEEKPHLETQLSLEDSVAKLFPPQWIQCDLRYFDMTILGKFSVIMADPPWDIHMELPYGTLSDDEMRQLNIPCLQEEGLIFLWVTGRAMELGRECLQLWGYERCDELIWVKTNQLQRIIRTGRTGHWMNHGKEHCLVGIKGNPPNINRGLDCDVIVAEVRATSHKPDEIYGIIERLSPGTRKIELFGRMQNVQPNWITLGNQLNGVRLLDPYLMEKFKARYPDGNCMRKPD